MITPRRTKTHHRISPTPMPLWTAIREVLSAQDLFTLLLTRELRIRYKQTALGIVWVVLQPLVPAIIFAFVFGAFARLPSSGMPYLLFALSGLVLYGLFSGSVGRAAGSLLRDSHLVTRVYFPRAVLPLASGTAALLDFAIGFGVLLVAMMAMGQAPPFTVLFVPLIAGLAGIFGLGFALGVSALSAHYRDFNHAIPFLLQVVLFASPVVYSLDLVPASVLWLYGLNPLVALIGAFRWAVLGAPSPELLHIAAGSLTGSAIVVAGVLIFLRFSRDVADVV